MRSEIKAWKRVGIRVWMREERERESIEEEKNRNFIELGAKVQNNTKRFVVLKY